MIQSPKISVMFKTVILYSAVLGILLQGGILNGYFSFASLRWFTVFSNLLVAVYYLIALLFSGEKSGSVWCPTLKFMALMTILLAGFVSHFLLHETGSGSSGVVRLAQILLHSVTPAGVLLDWLLFDARGLTRSTDPLFGVLPAALYVAVALIGAEFGYGLGSGSSRYPYSFLNVDRLGWPTVLLTVLGLAAAVILVGYLLYWMDHALSKTGRSRR